MIYVHNTFAKTKPLDTTVNYETRLYFTLQKNPQKFTLSIGSTNKNRADRINPPPPSNIRVKHPIKSKVNDFNFLIGFKKKFLLDLQHELQFAKGGRRIPARKITQLLIK